MPKKVNNGKKPAEHKIPIKHSKYRKQIEQDILNGTPYSKISQKYGYSLSTIAQYKKRHLVRKAKEYQNTKDIKSGEYLYNILAKYINNVNIIADSCINELKDPDNPDLLDVGTQATDVLITYRDSEGNRHKKDLQQIIDELNNKVDVLKVRVDRPDRIKTLIQASHAMNKHLSLLADIKGMIGNTTINIVNQPVFIEFTQRVVQALNPFPEAKKAVAEYLRTLDLVDRTDKSSILTEKTINPVKTEPNPSVGHLEQQAETPKPPSKALRASAEKHGNIVDLPLFKEN